MPPPKALRPSLSLHFRLRQFTQLLLGSSETPICICSPSFFSLKLNQLQVISVITPSRRYQDAYVCVLFFWPCFCLCLASGAVECADFVSGIGVIDDFHFVFGEILRVCCVTSNFSMLRSSSQKI